MRDFIQELKKYVTIGAVGGSDLVKQKEQLGADGIITYYCISNIKFRLFFLRKWISCISQW